MLAVKNFASTVAAAIIAVATVPGLSHAVSISDTLIPTGLDINTIHNGSYDSLDYNGFKPFEPFVSGTISTLGEFTVNPGVNNLEIFLLSENGYYDGTQNPALGNELGLMNTQGDYISILGSSLTAGDSAAATLPDNTEYRLALNSPEGLFTTDPSENPDGAVHFLAMEVTNPGQVFIEFATLTGLSSTFNLLVGDIIIFAEDLLAQGNLLGNGIPSDFDYNDMVFVVRQTEVPEPATALLLAAGLFGAHRRRKTAA